MYTHMQQLRQQLHIDVLRQHRRLQQLLQEQQQLKDRGERAEMEAQICPVKRQMSVIMGGVDDVVSNVILVIRAYQCVLTYKHDVAISACCRSNLMCAVMLAVCRVTWKMLSSGSTDQLCHGCLLRQTRSAPGLCHMSFDPLVKHLSYSSA